MSSVGEAKEKIAAASEEAGSAITAIGSAQTSIGDARKLLNEAASDSSHERVQDALGAYTEATGKLEEAQTALVGARDAGEEFAAHLG